MLDAIHTLAPDSALTPDERARNSFGYEEVYWFDATAAETLPSPLPDAFPSLSPCQTRSRRWVMPRMPVLVAPDDAASLAAVRSAAAARMTLPGDAGDVAPAAMGGGWTPMASDSVAIPVVQASMEAASQLYSTRPRPGTVVPAPGFPTLHTLPFTPILMPVSLNIFGMPSRKDTLILAVGGKGRYRANDTDEFGGDGDDEDDAFLAAAASAESPFVASATPASSNESSDETGDVLTPADTEDDSNDVVLPAAVHRSPHLLPPHVPCFSTTYAAGTTVAAAMKVGSPLIEDFVSAWRRNHEGTRTLTARAVAPELIGKVILVDWPHLREALVTSVADAMEEVMEDGSVMSHTPDGLVEWAHRAHALETEYLAGSKRIGIEGIRLGRVDVIITTRKLVGMRVDPVTGALHQVFGNLGGSATLRTVPDLILPLERHPAPDARFKPHGPVTTEMRFPLDASVVVLRGAARGCVARVTGYDEVPPPAPHLLHLSAMPMPVEAPFGRAAAQIKDKYFNVTECAASLRISPALFSRITGSVLVFPAKIDLGLNFKVRSGCHVVRVRAFRCLELVISTLRLLAFHINQVQRALYLAGYVRCLAREATAPAWASGVSASRAVAAGAGSAHYHGRDSEWEYTERACDIVAQYHKAFPEVFAVLAKHLDSPMIGVREFPGSVVTVERVAQWLSQLDTAKRPLLPLSSVVMAPVAVKSVETSVEAMKRRVASTAQAAPLELIRVAPSDVYRPQSLAYAVGAVGEGAGTALSAGNVDGASAVPILGDRVANLSFGPAPLGARATIVAVHSSSGFVEAVFDTEFLGGTTLGGLCSNGRGALVPWSALLCLSRPPTALAGAAASDDVDDDESNGQLAHAPRGRRGVVHESHSGASAPSHVAAHSATFTPAAVPHVRVVQQQQQQQQQQQKQSLGRQPAQPARAPPRRGGATAAHATASPSVGARDLPAIAAAVEMYFSDEHLAKDPFMADAVCKSSEGWVDVKVISAFKRMLDLAGGDAEVIATAVAKSKLLVVSDDRKRIKRVHAWAPRSALTGSSAAAVPVISSSPAVGGAPLRGKHSIPISALFASSAAAKSPVAAAPPASATSALLVPVGTLQAENLLQPQQPEIASYWDQQLSAASELPPVAAFVPPPAAAVSASAPSSRTMQTTLGTEVPNPVTAASTPGRSNFNAMLSALGQTTGAPRRA